MITAIPVFDTRADAESYRETLHMEGYERSFGWDVIIQRSEEGWEVVMRKIRADD